jgi:hypothetical protein
MTEISRETARGRIKAATHLLVERAGGIVAAGLVIDRSKSQVQRWQDLNAEDMIPAFYAVLLEAYVGQPLVSQAMAELTGHTLQPIDAQPAGEGFQKANMRVTREFADLIATVAEADEDGLRTPNERQKIEREAAELADALATFRNENAAEPSAVHAFPRKAG